MAPAMKFLVGLALLLSFASAQAVRPEALFDRSCASCHEAGSGKGPDRLALRKLSAEAVLQSMTSGSMVKQAAALDDAAKRVIAEYIGARKLGPVAAVTAIGGWKPLP